MKTNKNIRKLASIPITMLSLLTVLLNISCEKSNENLKPQINLSTVVSNVQIGDSLSVDLSFIDQSAFVKVKVTKSSNGIIDSSYHKDILVKDIGNPYTFKEEVVSGDENGTMIYSFFGLDASDKQVDASDLLINVLLAGTPLLKKYDWSLTSIMIAGFEFITPDTEDDIYRFNTDLTWQLDWGDLLSSGQLETLNSYCSWQIIGSESKIDSIYMIQYNIFDPITPIINKFRVISLEGQEMVLETRQDWSSLGLASDEIVVETFKAVSKSASFTPYRGSDPNSYFIDACKPGNY